MRIGSFYNSNTCIKSRWERKKVSQGELDRLTHAILKMVDGSIGAKCRPETKVIIGIGDAHFAHGVHATFQTHFVKKVTSLGYTVVALNAYFMSQMCPHMPQSN
jgi:hypothetical protein